MKKLVFPLLVSMLLLMACSLSSVARPASTLVPTLALAARQATPSSIPSPTLTMTATAVPASATPADTSTPAVTPTPAYPPEGRGPTGFGDGIDPLTGLQVKDAALLNRRPIVIKVENLPRMHRPQWGLSLADLVYEYYTEQGATRFAAIFYGNDAEQVGPIRSGRFFDANLVQMYKAIFVYGSAYPDVQNSFYNSDFYKRLVLENVRSCPALCRYDPNGQNLLVSNTGAMADYLKSHSVDNSRQNLDGMFFKYEPPAGGETASKVFVRYSGAIYNRWDYDPASGRYLRFSDKQDDVNRNNEVYEQLTDRLTSQPVAADNVVMLCVYHQYYLRNAETEVMQIIMGSQVASYTGCDGQKYKGNSGAAYIARDGKIYQAVWQRSANDSVLSLQNPDGSPFPLKPGQTWFEVLGASSQVGPNTGGLWHFTHRMVP